MHENDGLVKLYTGGDVIISRIKLELQAKGIIPMIKDRFNQGLSAGYGDGVPSAIDIFVTD
jgi:ArsR family metal-binding transcriptional regulator